MITDRERRELIIGMPEGEFLQVLSRLQLELKEALKLLDLLELRVYFIGCDKSKKTDYEINELEIIQIKTASEKSRIETIVDKLRSEYEMLHDCYCDCMKLGMEKIMFMA